MAKKYYAVKKGKAPGIYTTWDECKKQVMGYSCAVYKSFTDLDSAKQFMQSEGDLLCDDKAENDSCKVKIYVDGSYDKCSGMFSYGMVVLDGESKIGFKKAFNDPDLAEMRNVAGEIYGSIAAMKYCICKGIKDVVIYYDYEGIAKWALHEWKANKTGTKAYAAYYDKAKEKVNIEFRKVKGHSGDKYNDMADTLAKEALGLK